MSYILDALRKAEAERGRGAVPGIHVHQGPDVHPEPASADGHRVKILGWTVAALVVALGGTLAWRMLDHGPAMDGSRESAGPSAATTVAQAPAYGEPPIVAAPVAPVTSVAPVNPVAAMTRGARDASASLSPAPVTVVSEPAPVRAPAPAPAPAPDPGSAFNPSPPASPRNQQSVGAVPLEQPRATPSRALTTQPVTAQRAVRSTPVHADHVAEPMQQPRSTASATPATPATPTTTGAREQSIAMSMSNGAPMKAPAAQAVPTPPTVAAAVQPAAAPAPAPAPAPRIYAASDLPADIRSALPQYVVNGSSYSENAAARLLIVNGQIAREGDVLPGGVALEQIKLRAAVLRYKGYRYELTY